MNGPRAWTLFSFSLPNQIIVLMAERADQVSGWAGQAGINKKMGHGGYAVSG